VPEFFHLHNHTQYSLLDGMSTAEEIAEAVSNHGQSGAAITDHGTMAGTFAFQKAFDKRGLNAVMGVEAYYVPSLQADSGDKSSERFHLILLAKNDEGLRKLFELQQRAWTTGFYYKPRIEWDDLEYLSGDVIVLSGCMASYLCRLLENGKEDEAVETALQFRKRFGDDYYIELQPWNFDGLNDKLIGIAESLDIKLVGTIDCHYPSLNDKGFEEALLMMGQMPSLKAADKRYAVEHVGDAHKCEGLIDKINTLYPNRGLRFDAHANYVMSAEEVEKHFLEVGVTQDVYSATLEVADKCKSKIKTKQSLIPVFNPKFNSAEYLREIAELGLQELGFAKNQEYVDRLNEELSIINSLNFNDYFLIVWDICAFADRVGIYRGPGRGSVGGSLLAYCLSITKIDPIKYGLFFHRFINPERVSWPDIDLDFEDKRRSEIQEYIKERWQEDNVANISTYNLFKAKSVVKNAASVFQIPYQEMNKLTAKFETLDDLRHSKDGRAFVEENPHIYSVAKRLENRVKSSGGHAAGVVIASKPLYEVCPVETRGDEELDGVRYKVAAYDMNEVEEIGLIKFDILGLKALAVINDCLKKIEERYGIDVENESLALDDMDVIANFNSDSLVGIFQAEGAGYKNLIADMGIDSFDDLVASNALVRPGAYDTQGKEYVACKLGKQKAIYPHDILRPMLENTFGTFVYQEQLMQAVVLLAKFSWSDADVLRKIIGKKRDATEFDQFRDKWVDNAQEYIEQKTAEHMWSNFEKASTYMFNKSHSVGYSMLSYQTMWLKYHYPTEFIWACLTNENKTGDISGFLTEANRLGISVLPPDINASDSSFSLDGDSIRFGLGNVANCGPSAVKEIMEKRPYKTYDEFIGKVAKSKVRSNILENLTKVGALVSIGAGEEFDHKKYYLPILSWSKWAEDDNSFVDIISKIENITETNGIHVVRAMVKSAKRKPNYFRVELEDATGTISFFANDKEASIRAKDYLIAIAGNKNLLAFADANDEESPLIKFLNKWSNKEVDDIPGLHEFGSGRYQATILSSREFKTKTDKMMAHTWLFEPRSQTFQKVVVFPSQYEKLKDFLVPWSEVVINPGNKCDIIEGIISLERYQEIKQKATV
jgi:DNA polymerase-3 subunit alpha